MSCNSISDGSKCVLTKRGSKIRLDGAAGNICQAKPCAISLMKCMRSDARIRSGRPGLACIASYRLPASRDVNILHATSTTRVVNLCFLSTMASYHDLRISGGGGQKGILIYLSLQTVAHINYSVDRGTVRSNLKIVRARVS